eukprot:TRINITY_DN12278_c0_g1_i3.p1 TRINITY_DN12278_c0_g1~~TRINITY_DN12278_c0_g1_i3.p1  ORF type:complete len:810 (+),score=233.60 TRINITY_DN12278_c0_g1_i3:345-2432(+)
MTLHKFAGIGTGEGTKLDLYYKAVDSSSLRWWQNARVLIIDEISMISGELFDALDYIGKILRRNPKPFGGIQVICSGDFLQLPPISKKNQKPVSFCFQSKAWKETIEYNIELTTVFRQKDADFISLLNEIRHGKCTPNTISVLESCMNKQLDKPLDGQLEPTKLYALNAQVDQLNETRLSAIPRKGKVFRCKDKGRSEFLKQLEQCRAPSELKLKVGAQVMLLRNLDFKRGLVSGAQGIVVDFDNTNKGFPRVEFGNGQRETIVPSKWPILVSGLEVASRTQIPLKMSWAMSIHKCQGQTLYYAELDLSRVFEYGQAYVALSRVSSLPGLRLLSFNPNSIKAHPVVLEYYKNFDNYLLPSEVQSDISIKNPHYTPTKIPPPSTFYVLHKETDNKLSPKMEKKEEIQLNCVDHVFDVCKDCPLLKDFLLDSGKDNCSFKISKMRRKHLHKVIEHFNNFQFSPFGFKLEHSSDGAGKERILTVTKRKCEKGDVLKYSNLQKMDPLSTTPISPPSFQNMDVIKNTKSNSSTPDSDIQIIIDSDEDEEIETKRKEKQKGEVTATEKEKEDMDLCNKLEPFNLFTSSTLLENQTPAPSTKGSVLSRKKYSAYVENEISSMKLKKSKKQTVPDEPIDKMWDHVFETTTLLPPKPSTAPNTPYVPKNEERDGWLSSKTSKSLPPSTSKPNSKTKTPKTKTKK